MIERYDINEIWAHSGIIKAGDFCFLGYCVGNIGGTIEEQINGAFDDMERRLALVGFNLDNVVQLDCLFRVVFSVILYHERITPRMLLGFVVIFLAILLSQWDGKRGTSP